MHLAGRFPLGAVGRFFQRLIGGAKRGPERSDAFLDHHLSAGAERPGEASEKRVLVYFWGHFYSLSCRGHSSRSHGCVRAYTARAHAPLRDSEMVVGMKKSGKRLQDGRK